MRRERWLIGLGLAVPAALVWSGISPYDRTTWWLEVVPVLVAVPVLAMTRRRFPLTDLLYLLIFLHALVPIFGGAYTYARVPLGFWLQDWLGLGRNPYDKIGHFMQGLVPALLAREILWRGKHVANRRMLGFLAVCVALAVSALYELVEWWAALALGQGAEEFLGTQGDPWDTQSDMFLALLGALAAIICLGRLHDRRMRRLETGRTAGENPRPR